MSDFKQRHFANRLWHYKVHWLQGRCAEYFAGADASRSNWALIAPLLIHLINARTAKRDVLEAALKAQGGKVKPWGYAGVDVLPACLSLAETALFRAARQAIADWLRISPFESQWNPFEAGQIVALAEHLEIDIARDWQCDRDFLELYKKDELLNMIVDFRLSEADEPLESGAKRSEIIEWLMRHPIPEAPKELVKAKAP